MHRVHPCDKQRSVSSVPGWYWNGNCCLNWAAVTRDFWSTCTHASLCMPAYPSKACLLPEWSWDLSPSLLTVPASCLRHISKPFCFQEGFKQGRASSAAVITGQVTCLWHSNDQRQCSWHWALDLKSTCSLGRGFSWAVDEQPDLLTLQLCVLEEFKSYQVFWFWCRYLKGLVILQEICSSCCPASSTQLVLSFSKPE